MRFVLPTGVMSALKKIGSSPAPLPLKRGLAFTASRLRAVLVAPAHSTNVQVALVVVPSVQRWFQARYGLPQSRLDCGTCRCERLHTIWIDGTYRCLSCLIDETYASESLQPSEGTADFMAMWVEYLRRFKPELPWPFTPEPTEDKKVPPAPAFICVAETCETCASCRPHVLEPDGRKRCFHCAMTFIRATDLQLAQAKRTTRDRLNEAAAQAAAEASAGTL